MTDDRGYPWPTLDQYAISHHCTTCHATAGNPCGWRGHHSAGFHARRYLLAIRHQKRDIGNAPWRDERELGRCYCTLDPCPMGST